MSYNPYDVKIKSFKNGKIFITGLNKDSTDRLKYGFNVVNKHNHTTLYLNFFGGYH